MPCRAFLLCEAFSFFGVCEYMRRTFSELVKRFRGIVGRAERKTISLNHFIIACNGSNFACIAFCLLFGVLDRV